MTQMPVRRVILLSMLAALTWTGATAAAPAADAELAALLASPVRTDDDRKSDAGRQPLGLLRFAQVQPGQSVLDVSAGGGYTAQLMALAVGPAGRVWAQVEQRRPMLDKRLAAHPQPQLAVLVRPFEDLLPADAPRVDLVTLVLSYHDIAYAPVDRSKLNAAMFAALKPGGHLVLVDHAAKAGTGVADAKTLHRIDEQLVRREVEAAGFVFEADSDFLRNPADPREQAFFDMKQPADRFALRFVRP